MIVIVMGVSGAGKSTIGAALAEALGADFAEADRYHPIANIEKMTNGIPLNDADRWPWLDAIARDIHRWLAEKRNVVLACSALKKTYRQRLGAGSNDNIHVVYLQGTQALIGPRLQHRSGHFMPQSLLNSQFQTLEEPEKAITVNASLSPDAIVRHITNALNRN